MVSFVVTGMSVVNHTRQAAGRAVSKTLRLSPYLTVPVFNINGPNGVLQWCAMRGHQNCQ